ncbi:MULTISPECIES: aspartate carbamoyltransferase [unclassified Clostridium]|uniref:aspartate carbamoyltransferase n=1 Tax=unclassified Clostridium TaxID=2614128 RepID=UPI00052E407D|nr:MULTISPECIES: aspartate carbamoyltransferase [unclassified Clostridium]KGK82152.1 aspartate carbamoyltransferase catalytic subunit [Clostridium sp. HMP27]
MINVRNLIDPTDFSTDEINEILVLAQDMEKNPERYSNLCSGKILAALFYEPSTRTRLSFEAAMLRLGGRIIGFSEPNSTSVSKGESLEDTIKIISCYSDIIAIRHPKEGSAERASLYSDVPVINAGDGANQHPTQTLTDLSTIQNLKGRLSNLTVGLCGDLKFGRTVHSLIKALSRYSNNKIILISPDELKIPDYIKMEVLKNTSMEIHEVKSLEEVIDNLDILYMTRIQKERFDSEDEYLRLKDSYILTKEKLRNAKDDMLILHPLPRVNEIHPDVDLDKRATYFKQARYGMYVRMALISKLLGVI